MDTRSKGKTFAREKDEQEKENQEERFTSRLQGSRRQWQFGGRATFCPSPRDLGQKGPNGLGKGLGLHLTQTQTTTFRDAPGGGRGNGSSMGGRFGGGAKTGQVQPRLPLPLDGDRRGVQIRLGPTTQRQDGGLVGQSLRENFEDGTTSHSIANGSRERILQQDVPTVFGKGRDSSFFHGGRCQSLGGGTVQSHLEDAHVPLFHVGQHATLRGCASIVGERV